MWAQLPWLQVGVKNVSPVLVMDIVSMKLPSNALILIVSLSTDFTTNFMNRCRVNVVSGAQVTNSLSVDRVFCLAPYVINIVRPLNRVIVAFFKRIQFGLLDTI